MSENLSLVPEEEATSKQGVTPSENCCVGCQPLIVETLFARSGYIDIALAIMSVHSAIKP